MFYCKDVKYDMCELEKKNHDKKNKICKEFDDLTFHWAHFSVSLNLFCCMAVEPQRERDVKDALLLRDTS